MRPLMLFCLLCSNGQSAECRTANAKTGSVVFRIRCSTCHSTGKDSKVGPGLAGVLRGKHLSERGVRDIVKKGRRTMPPFGSKIAAEDLDDLIAYLRTI